MVDVVWSKNKHSSTAPGYVLLCSLTHLIEGLFNALFLYYVPTYDFLKISRISSSLLTLVKMEVWRLLLIVCTLAYD